MNGGRFDCWAITHPGVEAVTVAELGGLGISADAVEPGGVAFAADAAGIALANVRLRTAARVLVRLGEFRAASFAELERRAARLDWAAFTPPGAAVRFRVTSRKSRLYHQDAVAERLLRSVAAAVPGAVAGHGASDDHDGDEQLFIVRIFRDRCTVSADSSGPLLHRRGYRLATAKAPLRETLAAAMLLASGWEPAVPLADPLCGSGTIPIEAALIAAGRAPGAHRPFACERWPAFAAVPWQEIRGAAPAAGAAPRPVATAAASIAGSDRDPGAIRAAEANAARAGVADTTRFVRQPLSAAAPRAGEPAGWLITNPPYGVRVGERRPLRDLYARLGQLMRGPFAGWRLGLLVTHPELEAQLGLPLVTRFDTNNGGIRVRFVTTP